MRCITPIVLSVNVNVALTSFQRSPEHWRFRTAQEEHELNVAQEQAAAVQSHLDLAVEMRGSTDTSGTKDTFGQPKES